MTKNFKTYFLGTFLAVYPPLVMAQEHSYRPPQGFVPDEKTAIAIAVAIWVPLYGQKEIDDEKPYHANLAKGVWKVEGSLPKDQMGRVQLGGVAEAEISKEDGRIIRVSHGK